MSEKFCYCTTPTHVFAEVCGKCLLPLRKLSPERERELTVKMPADQEMRDLTWKQIVANCDIHIRDIEAENARFRAALGKIVKIGDDCTCMTQYCQFIQPAAKIAREALGNG